MRPPIPPRFPYTHNRADTTRKPRGGEQHGREYNFIDQEAFLKIVDEGGFIEHAKFGGNYYGTSVKAVKDVAEKGRICVLDIEMEVCIYLRTYSRVVSEASNMLVFA